MFRYKIDVMSELKAAGYPPSRLRGERLIGQNQLQLIRRGQMVGITVLGALCKVLRMQPGDIIEYVDDESTE